MAWVVTSEQMRALDRDAIERCGIPGVVLMERAALGVVDAVRDLQPRAVVVMAGPGNNGGDGSAVARLLHTGGVDVTLVDAGARRSAGDAAVHFAAAQRVGVPIVGADPDSLRAVWLRADVWVDALLGIGQTRPPSGAIGDVVRAANTARRRDTRVVAVDVATGVDADTARVFDPALRADVTVTFEHRKWGHVLPGGAEASGRVIVAPIGVPRDAALKPSPCGWYDCATAASEFLPFAAGDHKGDRGRVLVVAGCDDTPGAALLSASAALRSGAGLVTLCAPESLRPLLGARPELMFTPRRDVGAKVAAHAGALVVGPGLSFADARHVAEALEAADVHPVVVDATALRIVAADGLVVPENAILTPHPGELAALIGGGTTTADVIANLPAAAAHVAEERDVVVIAKTAGAFVAAGARNWFVAPGHPGMATAGAGDVLAGIVVAVACRHDAARAARLGAWLHAASGRAAGARRGSAALVAGDIVESLGDAFAELEGQCIGSPQRTGRTHPC